MISAQHFQILSAAEFCDERVHLLPSFLVATSAMPGGGGADRIGDERIGSCRGGARDVMGRQQHMDENILRVASTPSPPYPRDGLIMLIFSHYNFRKRLLDKARNYKDTNVLIVNEAYTTKTCTCCGTIHNKFGVNKTFDCRSCS